MAETLSIIFKYGLAARGQLTPKFRQKELQMLSNTLDFLYNLFNTNAAANNGVAATKPIRSKLMTWLECMDFALAAKAHGADLLPVNLSSLRHFKAGTSEAYVISYRGNKVISDVLKHSPSLSFQVADNLVQAGMEVEKKTKPVLEQLRKASIYDKREVLRYAQIIPSSIAAAYIGISEHALNEWNKNNHIFGATYAGGHCYSLEEAKIVAKNRLWITNYVCGDDVRETAVDDEKVLDEVVMVDYDFASAFANLAWDELDNQLPRNQLSKRPFRLSDLEKIRVAKLNAQQ